MQGAVFLLVVVYVFIVDAQIPIPCANVESLTERLCCPVPDPNTFENAGPCGANLGRGSCQPIAIPDSEFNPAETDVRLKWPIQYFNSTCVCAERFGGYDCGECSYAYNDGTTDCEKKTVRPRISVAEMTDDDWTGYRAALMKVKFNPSRYTVATINFTTDLQALVYSMVNPTSYDLFTWIHHTAAKDNNLTIDTDNFLDFAHEGPGFPTWHRRHLLWLEREIQREIGDHLFRLPYWDWRNPAQRDVLFKTDRLGVNMDGNVVGDLFGNWTTVCWQNILGKTPPIDVCNPNAPTDQNLRRCPNAALCDKSNEKWPSYEDVATALSIENYDTSPYDRFVEDTSESYRNYMEGFITQPGSNCGDDTLCTVDKARNVVVRRKIHNPVHTILGIGDLHFGPDIPFEQTGVMADVAAAPNDPIFINHHVMADCILEEWLQRNKEDLTYPISDEIRKSHRAGDYIVPIIPLHMQKDMFKTADNFGYSCFLPGPNECSEDDASVSLRAYTTLVIGLLVVTVLCSI